MRAIVTRSAGEFADRAGAFLAGRPIEHNVLATVLHDLRAGELLDAEPIFAWVESGEVVAAALQTPPRPLLASTMSRAAAEALMPALLESGVALPGVIGTQPAQGSPCTV